MELMFFSLSTLPLSEMGCEHDDTSLNGINIFIQLFLASFFFILPVFIRQVSFSMV